MPKDLFSEQSQAYATYRPVYPQKLFDYILSFVEQKKMAWDCATGNGQAATMLADYFEKVEATDISAAQIERAAQKNNIHYQVAPAEHTSFPENTFDLITVAQAYHWIDWRAFYTEATRTAKPDAVVAIWCYNLMTTDDEKLNKIIKHFYFDITGPHWDAARKFVDDGYKTVTFDFSPLPSKDFEISLNWSKEAFKGYLSSWSSVREYIRENGSNPIHLIEPDLDAMWNDNDVINFRFPIFLKLGRIVK